jgi:galactonate dehydratase
MDTYLLGEDPTPIEDYWQTMYRGGFYRGGPVLISAIAGIDQALWDLKGKQFGAPVYELLGGRARERVRVYQWVGGDRPAGVAEAAREKVSEGFTALKMNATAELRRIDSPAAVEAARERLAAVRDAVGPTVDVGVDFHCRVSKSMARRLTAGETTIVHDPETDRPAVFDASDSTNENTSAEPVELEAIRPFDGAQTAFWSQ